MGGLPATARASPPLRHDLDLKPPETDLNPMDVELIDGKAWRRTLA